MANRNGAVSHSLLTIDSFVNMVRPFCSTDTLSQLSTTIQNVSNAVSRYFRSEYRNAALGVLACASYYAAPISFPLFVLGGAALGYTYAQAKYNKLCTEFHEGEKTQTGKNAVSEQPKPQETPKDDNTEVLVHGALTVLQFVSPVFSTAFTAIHAMLVGSKLGRYWLHYGKAMHDKGSLFMQSFPPIDWQKMDPQLKTWIEKRL